MKILDPKLEGFMYERSNAKIVDIKASHLPHISQPEAVADVIVDAADGS